MERETPWRITPPPGPEGDELKTLLEEARRVDPWTTSERALGWWRIAEAASAPRRRHRRLFAFAAAGLVAATAAGVIGFVAVHSPSDAGTVTVERLLPDGDILEASPGAVYSVEPVRVAQRDGVNERVLRLDSGHFDAKVVPHADGDRFIVVTPHVTVRVAATRFLVDVERGVTTVFVQEGSAQVRGASGIEVTVSAGERVRSDDPRLKAAGAVAPTPLGPTVPANGSAAPDAVVAAKPRLTIAPLQIRAAAPSTRCDGAGAVGARVACLQKLSKGSGLAAQTALYALALSESNQGRDVRERWHEYQLRFPNGVFAPEVSIALMSSHYEQGNRTEALKEADAFLRRFADDARAKQVTAWRDAVLDAMKLSAGPGQESP